jgi:hypothetical protein
MCHYVPLTIHLLGMVNIVVHQNVQVLDVIVSDVLDSDRLGIFLIILTSSQIGSSFKAFPLI